MTMTTNSAFDVLQSNIELPSSFAARVSSRYSSIRDHLLGVFDYGTQIRQIGSFQRKTKVKPSRSDLSIDLDIAVVFADVDEYALQKIKPAMIFAELIKALSKNKNYKSMKRKANAPIVELVYADDFSVELVPCFRLVTRLTGPNDSYCISLNGKDWTIADYDDDAAYLTRINQDVCNGTLIPFIKQVKYLFRRFKQCDNMSSIHLEALCANIYPEILRDFESSWLPFSKADYITRFLTTAPRYITLPISIPGSRSRPLGSELTYQELQAIGQIMVRYGTHAQTIASKPLQHQINFWRNLFGPAFPIG